MSDDFMTPSEEIDLSFLGDDGMISLDFTDVKEMDFNPAPPGNYLASIYECTLEKSSQKGTPCLNLKFELYGCADKNPAPGAENCEGKRVFTKLWLTQKSMPMNKPFFNAVAGGEAKSLNFKPEQLVGSKLGVVLTVGTWTKVDEEAGTSEIRKNNQITGYFPIPNI